MMLLIFINFLFLLFGKADDQPQFKGGENALYQFLSVNIVYPEYSSQNCISGTVFVSFNIDQIGKVSNVKVYKGLGVDLDDEAVRVVRLTSGKWTASLAHDVHERIVLPIKFNVEQTRCQTFDALRTRSAIEAYRQREALVKVVTNYYSNKYLGKADTTKEQQIIALKQELGFDAGYAAEVLEQANRKYKQGDHESACEDWLFIRNIGSEIADVLLSKNCN